MKKLCLYLFGLIFLCCCSATSFAGKNKLTARACALQGEKPGRIESYLRRNYPDDPEKVQEILRRKATVAAFKQAVEHGNFFTAATYVSALSKDLDAAGIVLDTIKTKLRGTDHKKTIRTTKANFTLLDQLIEHGLQNQKPKNLLKTILEIETQFYEKSRNDGRTSPEPDDNEEHYSWLERELFLKSLEGCRNNDPESCFKFNEFKSVISLWVSNWYDRQNTPDKDIQERLVKKGITGFYDPEHTSDALMFIIDVLDIEDGDANATCFYLFSEICKQIPTQGPFDQNILLKNLCKKAQNCFLLPDAFMKIIDAGITTFMKNKYPDLDAKIITELYENDGTRDWLLKTILPELAPDDDRARMIVKLIVADPHGVTPLGLLHHLAKNGITLTKEETEECKKALKNICTDGCHTMSKNLLGYLHWARLIQPLPIVIQKDSDLINFMRYQHLPFDNKMIPDTDLVSWVMRGHPLLTAWEDPHGAFRQLKYVYEDVHRGCNEIPGKSILDNLHFEENCFFPEKAYPETFLEFLKIIGEKLDTEVLLGKNYFKESLDNNTFHNLLTIAMLLDCQGLAPKKLKEYLPKPDNICHQIKSTEDKKFPPAEFTYVYKQAPQKQ